MKTTKTIARTLVLVSPLLTLATLGCEKKPEGEAPAASASATLSHSQGAKTGFARVARLNFNRIAAELALPIFWSQDTNKNGVVEPDEVSVYWGIDSRGRDEWVSNNAFTPEFTKSYEAIAKRDANGPDYPATMDAKEKARRTAVLKELAQGRQTLVETDLSKSEANEKELVKHILKAAETIEIIFAKQMGAFDLKGKVPADDPASRMAFFRNQGPKCEAPDTQNDAACNAITDALPKKLSGLYPQAQLLADDKFCESLSKKDKKLADPFQVVTGDEKGLKAVAYTEAYGPEMKIVADELTKAAATLDSKEEAFKTYLTAAAKAFGDNNWFAADEAWAKMGVNNSKWYLRIGPDEVYAEPCSNKALFHVSFGLINQDSKKWQSKLDPLKSAMETAIADLAGAPYKARSVTFKLPDFINVALNAGDARAARGATIGQSLPNFGPVANEGRGRTVAMTNFYTDPDSIASQRATAESLLCKTVMPKYTTDPEPQLMSTVLHEAAHNLGPAHQYKVNGKIDRDQFGGPLASTLEELKAQTSALYFTDWLADRKDITADERDRAHVRDVLWGFGHIAQGMYTEDKHPKSYSQLAAIQFGYLSEHGAIAWHADEIAANGKDKGCFAIALDKFPENVKELEKVVTGIKARGDKELAQKLVAEYVDVEGDKKKAHDVIRERVLRSPKPSFVYSIRFDR